MKNYCLLLLFLVSLQDGYAQDSLRGEIAIHENNTYDVDPSTAKMPKKIWLATAITSFSAGGTLVALNQSWYKDFPHTSFHLFNDGREWLQVDKAGHAWSTYNFAKNATALWHWSGLPHQKAAWIGGLSSLGFMTAIEYMDAHSAKWGWSWSDMAANIAGIGLFSAQDMVWGEQKIQFKFSAHPGAYDDALQERTDALFGKNITQRLLKDYNNQTYWLSANLHSFFKESNLPPWLNIAVGYGADGLLGGFENSWTDKAGSTVTRYDIPRTRQFYISPDVDFTKIKTGSKGLKTIFSMLNILKMPAPALMLSNGKLKGYFLYF